MATNVWSRSSIRARASATLAVVLAATLVAPPAMAQWQTHRGANVRFDVPDGWQMRTNANVMVIAPPQGGVAVEFVALTNPAEVAQAEQAVALAVRRQFQQVQVTRPARPIVQNGLRGVGARGLGLRNGQVMDWFAVALGAQGRGIVAIGFARQGQLDANMGTIMHTLNSIQPAS
jgi:predicted Zn-dependent protease